MSLRPTDPEPIPADTASVARAAFPKGTAVMRLRDERGPIDCAREVSMGKGLE